MIPTALSKTSRSRLTRVLIRLRKAGRRLCGRAPDLGYQELRVFGPVANAYRSRRTYRTFDTQTDLARGSRPFTRCNQCPLVAQSGHPDTLSQCLLLGAKRTLI